MTILRSASATWEGNIKEGKGTVSSASGVLTSEPYGFNTRFENQPGTNPEELLGAAHAACFTMALALTFTKNGVIARQIDTTADVSLEKQGEGFAITHVHLKVIAQVPGLAKDTFLLLAEKTKKECPVSKVLNAEISLSAELKEA